MLMSTTLSTPQSLTDESVDVAVVGGGLVGASLALMLAQLKLRAVLIEALPFGTAEQPSFDERTTALSNGSRRIFEALEVWPGLARSAAAIRRIHVSDKGRFGFARLSAEEQGLSALGFVVVNRLLGAALWGRLQAQQVRVMAPARVVNVRREENHCALEVEHDASRVAVRAKLVVAADGANSAVRAAAGIASTSKDYAQTAIICNAAPQRFHDHVAYERFTPTGPIAVLPLTDARVGLIWTVASETAAEVSALSDAEFLRRFQNEFGFRLGRFSRVGRRFSYPLSLTRASTHIAPRLAVVGNAAQGLHPIAGQGLNLGLRDAASLAEVLADALSPASADFDPGAASILARYSEWRVQDSRRIVAFTDGLVRGFSKAPGPLALLRDVGLLAFDLLPPAKDALSQLSLGAAGKIPRLARGAPLRA